MTEAQELAGRAAVVTGASKNIGRSIAVALGEAGASVLIHANCDREGLQGTAELVRQAGGQAEIALGDLTDPETAGRLVEAAVAAFGRLDIVVANAAIRPETTIDDMSFEDWRRVMAVCLDSVFLLAKAALPALRQSDQAAIVSIGGMTGHSGAGKRAHVITAKAGVAGLTKALAHDLAKDGITANCIAPGLIETQRVNVAHHRGTTTNVLGRPGAPEEVAAAVRMLCGPGARYITGQTLHVNGGGLMV